MREGQEQLRKCIDILAAMTIQQKRAIYPFVPWASITSVYGVVVSSGGTPLSTFDYSQFPAITLEAFTRTLRSNDFMKPSRLWAACRNRDWLEHFDNAEAVDVEMRIGELTYLLPGFSYERGRKG